MKIRTKAEYVAHGNQVLWDNGSTENEDGSVNMGMQLLVCTISDLVETDPEDDMTPAEWMAATLNRLEGES